MMNVIDVLELVELTSGTNAKVDVLAKYKDVPHLRDFFRICEDPTIDFGVKKVTIPGNRECMPSPKRVPAFLDLLESKLAPRLLTGNAAKETVVDQLTAMDPLTQKWCLRLLLRNLRVGVSGKLLERVWPKLVNRYAVLLATAVPVDKGNIPVGVKFPVWGEPKLDGLRCIAEKRNGKVTLRTRNGNLLETLPAIKAALEACPSDDFMLDGEAMINRADQESWNDSASVLMSRKNKKSDSDMVYNVFDGMPIANWDAKSCSIVQRTRKSISAKIAERTASPTVVSVVGRILNSMEELLAFFDECLENGYEGIMLKSLDGLYEWKRVKTSVMKYKPVDTYEGVVVGWYEGGVGTKNADRFGGFHVLLDNKVITRVGGGYSDALRNQINEDPDEFFGRVVECEAAKGLAKNGKLRFPVFCRFRDASDVDPKLFDALKEWVKEQR